MNVVVTGGGTIAPIDDVRFIANVSSGRFSAAISEACLRRGAAVWHVHAPTALLPFHHSARLDLDAPDPTAEHARIAALERDYQAVRARLHLVPLQYGSVAEYFSALHQVFHQRPIHVAFLAMAVSDFEPIPILGKIESNTEELTIRCRRTPKVIRSVRDWAPDVFLVGFKLLSGTAQDDLIRAAEIACATNRADLTIANDLSTLRAGRHTVHLVRPGLPVETFGPGDGLAAEVVDRVLELAAEKAEKNEARPVR